MWLAQADPENSHDRALACLAKLHTVLNIAVQSYFPVAGIIPHLSISRNLAYNSDQILVSRELKRKSLAVGLKYLNPGLYRKEHEYA